jgi:hypothetical protein
MVTSRFHWVPVAGSDMSVARLIAMDRIMSPARGWSAPPRR